MAPMSLYVPGAPSVGLRRRVYLPSIGGAPVEALPIAPVLSVTSATTEVNPSYLVEYYGASPVLAGWVLTLQRKLSSADWSTATSVDSTIASGMTLTMDMPDASSGDYVARARFTNSAGAGTWSDEVPFSIFFASHPTVVAYPIQFTETGSSSSTFSGIDVGTGAKKLVVAMVGRGDGTAFGGVTVNGVAMTSIENRSSGNSWGSTALFHLDVNPSAPVNIVANWGSGKPFQPKALQVWSMTGNSSSAVKQLAPPPANSNQPVVLPVNQGDAVFFLRSGAGDYTTCAGNSTEDPAIEQKDTTYGIFMFDVFFPSANNSTFTIYEKSSSTSADRAGVSFA